MQRMIPIRDFSARIADQHSCMDVPWLVLLRAKGGITVVGHVLKLIKTVFFAGGLCLLRSHQRIPGRSSIFYIEYEARARRKPA